MVSEIKGTGTHAPQTVDTTVRNKVERTATSNATAATSGDVVTLTDLASRLQRLTDSVRDLPVVDQARVAELRDQIESGRYQVEDGEIADKVAAFEAQLGLRDGR
ncbi:MAG: flagellar biosynthesis anti-sigma factor FlgM [Gammaproteobacteria bacterium]|nr:flagellar biosynthesis anti-sigma factor FlgM [Gammaproteobacteria bacterium]MCP5202312.1 flagellar biosynthesis anti-sigma factor FlgM [Gammaproteobacteria bacterium]